MGIATGLDVRQRRRGQEVKRLAKNADELAQKLRSGLSMSQRAAIAKRVAQIPQTMRLSYLAAMNGKSRKAAITSFCLECVGWQRDEVAACTAPACPLYPYRPFQSMEVQS